MIRLAKGRFPIITFFRFLKTTWNCRRGNHTPVQMDSDCWYCGLRCEKSGDSAYDDKPWSLKSRGWSQIKKIASHFYCWN